MYIYYNPNPVASRVQDCTVRAICKLTGKRWEEVFLNLCLYGLLECDMPSANRVWSRYLRRLGYEKSPIYRNCPDCYTVENFASEYPHGSYLLALDGHVVTVSDGDWYDTWDSGQEAPFYYWHKEEY